MAKFASESQRLPRVEPGDIDKLAEIEDFDLLKTSAVLAETNPHLREFILNYAPYLEATGRPLDKNAVAGLALTG